MYENHVIFEISGQYYSINSLKVKSIEAACSVEHLIGAPENVLGTAALRGVYYPVYSLHKKFGVPERKTATTQYLFVEASSGLIGIVVDSVREIAMLDTEEQTGVPVIVRNEATGYVAGIIRHNGELITMINPDKILSPAEVSSIERCLKNK